MKKKALAALIGAAALALSAGASAQTYPSRNVRILVPFGVGGPADVFARIIGEQLSKSLGQGFVIENKPGAGAVVGTAEAAKAAPDGYTLLMMSNTQATNEALIPNKPYALMRDFAPVAAINYSDLVMVIHPSVPARTLKEFIALAQSKPNGLNYASSGPGTPYHMAGELFKAMSKTQITHVPYTSSGGARNDVLAGHVHMMFDAVTTMAPNVATGKLVALGVSGDKRNEVMPEAPTVNEAGVPGYAATIWLGIMAPKATPREILVKLNAEINKIQQRPDIKADWAKQGAIPYNMTVDEFSGFLDKEIEKWSEVVRISGAKVQ